MKNKKSVGGFLPLTPRGMAGPRETTGLETPPQAEADLGQRTIRILLSRFSDPLSTLLSVLTLFHYTHASIGLGEEGDVFYSFVFQGFVTERLGRWAQGQGAPRSCAPYEVPVPEAAYQKAKAVLEDMARRREDYRYDPFGLVLSILRIPHAVRGRFFCSQFVAYVLGESRAFRLEKSCSLYFPRDLSRLPGLRLVFQGEVGGHALGALA